MGRKQMKKDKKESIILIARYKRWLERAIKNLVITKKEFKAEFAWSKEATPFRERKKLKFKPIKKIRIGVKNGKVLGLILKERSQRAGEEKLLQLN